MTATTVVGTLAGEPALLRWRDGHVDGTQLALDLLLALRGEVRAGPQWPSLEDPDVTEHLSFVVGVLALLDNADITGDLPYVEPLPDGVIA